jgi:hypothetical protein
MLIDIILEPTKRAVSFKPLTFYDRQAAVRRYEGRAAGYTLEEYMAALALQKVGGQVVNQESYGIDPMDHLRDWDHREAQYYFEVFNAICLLDDRARLHAIEQAKNVMGASSTYTPPQAGTPPTSRPRVGGTTTTEV